MKLSVVISFAIVLYAVSAASIYPELRVVREKRAPVLGTAALGAGALGAGVLGAGVLGAGVLGAGVLGAGAAGVGLGLAKGAVIGKAIGYSHGGYGGHYYDEPEVVHVHHVDTYHHYDHDHYNDHYDW